MTVGDPYLLYNISMSVHYRIWHQLVQHGWTVQRNGIQMVELEGIGIPNHTYYAPQSNPWVFLDADQQPWPSGVTVYDAGNPLPSGNYTIDYMTPSVTLDAAPSGAVTVDALTSFVRVVDAYPTEEQLEKWQLPIIAVEIPGSRLSPFDIGSSAMWVTPDVTIDVLCQNQSQRLVLPHTIMRYIKYLPLRDYRTGAPINEDGTLNMDYAPGDHTQDLMNMSDQPSLRNLSPRTGGSDKERFRSLITFTVEKIG